MALNAKWIPVFENEELAKKVVPMPPEEAQKVLAENGFDFTMDEILEAGRELYAMKEKMSGELDENDLEAVAGGIKMSTVKTITQCVGAALYYW